MSNYCEHIAKLVPPKLPIPKHYQCGSCRVTPPQVWICQAKGCGTMACELNRNKHMTDHHECKQRVSIEFRAGHSIFINPVTAELRCVLCRIEILDFDQMSEEERNALVRFADPFSFRERYLKQSEPPLQYDTGNLQNSAAHKRSNRGLCGLVDRLHQTAISSTVQFLSNVPFYKSLMKRCRIDSLQGDNSRLLQCLFALVQKIWSGENRVLQLNELPKLIMEKLPRFKSYHRKDPFDLLIFILNALHEQLKFYDFEDLNKLQDPPRDDWEIISEAQREKERSVYTDYSPIKDPVQADITYSLECKRCNITKALKGQLFRLQLEIPKVRKKSKEIEEEMGRHKYQSPFRRRRSLLDRLLGFQDEFPMSFVQLLVEYMKNRAPQDKQKLNCAVCSNPMIVGQCRFLTLPKIMLVRVARTQKDNDLWSNQYIDFPDNVDLSGFVSTGFKGSTVYDLNSIVCLSDNNIDFFTVARNCKNKQKYQFRGASVKINNEKHPVYLACYTLKDQNSSFYHNIKSNARLQIAPECILPEFWLLQLKYFYPGPLFQPMCCKHGKIRMRVEPHCSRNNFVPKAIYEALLDKYDGREMLNEKCLHCYKELAGLAMRKKKEKEAVTRFDGYKCRLFCMVSCQWVNYWTDFLYRKKGFNYYLSKGLPLPGPIRNGVLLESQNRCRPDLKKGHDYKVVNIYVWTFFRELYGGGPEIQYRTKHQPEGKPPAADPEVLLQIQEKVRELKQYLSEEYYMSHDWQESPMKQSKADDSFFRLSRQLSKEMGKDDK